jgi:excisionase family DNA binding protein
MANLAKQYIDLGQASSQYSIPIDTLRKWARDGKIPAFRIGRKYLIDIEQMERYIETKQSAADGVHDAE